MFVCKKSKKTDRVPPASSHAEKHLRGAAKVNANFPQFFHTSTGWQAVSSTPGDRNIECLGGDFFQKGFQGFTP